MNLREDEHKLVQKYSDSPLVQPEKERQRSTKKFTQEAAQELNIHKEELKQEPNIPNSIRDSEALKIAIRRSNIYADLRELLRSEQDLDQEIKEKCEALFEQDL